jgi:hypothetical protein
MMALGATRSVSSMDLFPRMLEAQQGWHRKGADHKYPPGARQWSFFSTVGGPIQPIRSSARR